MRREGSPEVAITQPTWTRLRKIHNITSLLRRLSHQSLVFGPLFNVEAVIVLIVTSTYLATLNTAHMALPGCSGKICYHM
jgi:hypothetical protein